MLKADVQAACPWTFRTKGVLLGLSLAENKLLIFVQEMRAVGVLLETQMYLLG